MKAFAHPAPIERAPIVRLFLACVLSVALLLASFHATPAVADDSATPQGVVLVYQNDTPTHGADQSPGHAAQCHCLLHISAQAMAWAVAVPAAFNRGYVASPDTIQPSAANGLPYKPPRA